MKSHDLCIISVIVYTLNANKDKAHVKTLGKWFNDVYNKRELYIYSKRLSLYVYKNKKTKIQQTNASKSTMYPDSHT